MIRSWKSWLTHDEIRMREDALISSFEHSGFFRRRYLRVVIFRVRMIGELRCYPACRPVDH